MKKTMKNIPLLLSKIFIGLILSLISCGIYASNSYSCQVKWVGKVSENGVMEEDKYEVLMNQKFVIERSTGRLLGRFINDEDNYVLRNSPRYKPQIIDYGREYFSYKLLGISERDGHSMIYFFEINDFFEPNSITKLKRKMTFNGQFYFNISGICEYL